MRHRPEGEDECVAISLGIDDRQRTEFVDEDLHRLAIPIPFFSEPFVRGRIGSAQYLAFHVVNDIATLDVFYQPDEGIVSGKTMVAF